MKCSRDLFFVSFFAVRRKERRNASFLPHPPTPGREHGWCLYPPPWKAGLLKLYPFGVLKCYGVCFPASFNPVFYMNQFVLMVVGLSVLCLDAKNQKSRLRVKWLKSVWVLAFVPVAPLQSVKQNKLVPPKAAELQTLFCFWLCLYNHHFTGIPGLFS